MPEVALRRAARDAATLTHAWGTAVAVTLGAQGALLSVGDDIPFMAPAPNPAAEAYLGLRGTPAAPGTASPRRPPRSSGPGGLLTEAVTEAVRRASEFVGRGGPAVVPGLTVPPEAERLCPDRQPPA